jgi:hypothetical protein
MSETFQVIHHAGGDEIVVPPEQGHLAIPVLAVLLGLAVTLLVVWWLIRRR